MFKDLQVQAGYGPAVRGRGVSRADGEPRADGELHVELISAAKIQCMCVVFPLMLFLGNGVCYTGLGVRARGLAGILFLYMKAGFRAWCMVLCLIFERSSGCIFVQQHRT